MNSHEIIQKLFENDELFCKAMKDLNIDAQTSIRKLDDYISTMEGVFNTTINESNADIKKKNNIISKYNNWLSSYNKACGKIFGMTGLNADMYLKMLNKLNVANNQIVNENNDIDELLISIDQSHNVLKDLINNTKEEFNKIFDNEEIDNNILPQIEHLKVIIEKDYEIINAIDDEYTNLLSKYTINRSNVEKPIIVTKPVEELQNFYNMNYKEIVKASETNDVLKNILKTIQEKKDEEINNLNKNINELSALNKENDKFLDEHLKQTQEKINDLTSTIVSLTQKNENVDEVINKITNIFQNLSHILKSMKDLSLEYNAIFNEYSKELINLDKNDAKETKENLISINELLQKNIHNQKELHTQYTYFVESLKSDKDLEEIVKYTLDLYDSRFSVLTNLLDRLSRESSLLINYFKKVSDEASNEVEVSNEYDNNNLEYNPTNYLIKIIDYEKHSNDVLNKVLTKLTDQKTKEFNEYKTLMFQKDDEISSLNEKIRELTLEKDELKYKYTIETQELENEHTKIKNELDDMRSNNETLESSLSTKTEELNNVENNLALLKENYDKDIETLNNQIQSKETIINELQQSFDENKKDLEEKTNEYINCSNSLSNAMSELGSKNNEVLGYVDKLNENTKKLTELETVLDILSTEKDTIDKLYSGLKVEFNNLKSSNDVLLSQQTELTNNKSILNEKIKELTERLNDKDIIINDLNNKIEILENENEQIIDNNLKNFVEAEPMVVDPNTNAPNMNTPNTNIPSRKRKLSEPQESIKMKNEKNENTLRELALESNTMYSKLMDNLNNVDFNQMNDYIKLVHRTIKKATKDLLEEENNEEKININYIINVQIRNLGVLTSYIMPEITFSSVRNIFNILTNVNYQNDSVVDFVATINNISTLLENYKEKQLVYNVINSEFNNLNELDIALNKLAADKQITLNRLTNNQIKINILENVLRELETNDENINFNDVTTTQDFKDKLDSLYMARTKNILDKDFNDIYNTLQYINKNLPSITLKPLTELPKIYTIENLGSTIAPTINQVKDMLDLFNQRNNLINECEITKQTLNDVSKVIKPLLGNKKYDTITESNNNATISSLGFVIDKIFNFMNYLNGIFTTYDTPIKDVTNAFKDYDLNYDEFLVALEKLEMDKVDISQKFMSDLKIKNDMCKINSKRLQHIFATLQINPEDTINYDEVEAIVDNLTTNPDLYKPSLQRIYQLQKIIYDQQNTIKKKTAKLNKIILDVKKVREELLRELRKEKNNNIRDCFHLIIDGLDKIIQTKI